MTVTLHECCISHKRTRRFAPAIAHSIREQVLRARSSVVSGSPVVVLASAGPMMTRQSGEDYSPRVSFLSRAELDRLHQYRNREARCVPALSVRLLATCAHSTRRRHRRETNRHSTRGGIMHNLTPQHAAATPEPPKRSAPAHDSANSMDHLPAATVIRRAGPTPGLRRTNAYSLLPENWQCAACGRTKSEVSIVRRGPSGRMVRDSVVRAIEPLIACGLCRLCAIHVVSRGSADLSGCQSSSAISD